MTPERAALDALTGAGLTLAIAESCTGGLIASRLTALPGASRALLRAEVPYANEAKIDLGVSPGLLEAHGAVSAEVAADMARAVRERAGADLGLSATCIAGPSGATPAKPVGLAFAAVAGPEGIDVRRLDLAGSRAWVREQLLEGALALLLDRLGGSIPPQEGTAVVVVGDEVLRGHTRDTNSGTIAAALFEFGCPPVRVITVGDDPDGIADALLHALRRAATVIVTGGLGPTPDDRTVEAVARLLGMPVEEHPAALAMVERRLAEGHARGHVPDPTMNEGRRKMARLPRGAVVLENDVGYGPGFRIGSTGRTIFALPGVPAEMEHLLARHVVPHLAGSLPGGEHVETVTYRGSESDIAPLMDELAGTFPGVHVGSYPDLGSYSTTIRLTGPPDVTADAARWLRKRIGTSG